MTARKKKHVTIGVVVAIVMGAVTIGGIVFKGGERFVAVEAKAAVVEAKAGAVEAGVNANLQKITELDKQNAVIKNELKHIKKAVDDNKVLLEGIYREVMR